MEEKIPIATATATTDPTTTGMVRLFDTRFHVFVFLFDVVVVLLTVGIFDDGDLTSDGCTTDEEDEEGRGRLCRRVVFGFLNGSSLSYEPAPPASQ